MFILMVLLSMVSDVRLMFIMFINIKKVVLKMVILVVLMVSCCVVGCIFFCLVRNVVDWLFDYWLN